MFWQFENWTGTNIDKLLENQDVTLQQILAEEDVIQECKAQNSKLVAFLTKQEIMEQMINLIITVPDESLDPKIRFKDANVACELLTSELDVINDALIQENNLELLYSFIESSSRRDGSDEAEGDAQSKGSTGQQLNPLLASFVSKTFTVLINKRPQGLFDFLKTKESFVSDILSHIEVSAMTDFLLKLMTGIENQEIKDSVDSWLSQKNLIDSLVQFLDKNTSRQESQFNATQLLCDFVRICREQQSMLQEKATANPLLQALESSETVDSILRLMFDSNTDTAVVQGIHILQSLIEYKRHNANLNQPPQPPPAPVDASNESNPDAADFEGVPQTLIQQQQPIFGGTTEAGTCLSGIDTVSALDASRLAQSVCQVHAAVLPRLSQFHDFLSSEPSLRPIMTTTGILERPLGAARIEAVHFIRALLSSNNPAINRALASLKTLSLLINLFFKYSWNSFLHIQVEQSIKLIFENSKATSPVTSPTEEESNSSKKPEDGSSQEAAVLLVKELIQDTCLISEIPKIWTKFNQRIEGLDVEVPVTTEPRPAYMGHLVKIANHINESVTADETIKKLLDDVPAEFLEHWNDFVQNSLLKVNERMKTPLVPDAPSSGYDETSQRQESILHQAFLQYQMMQMTKNICTDSAFNTSDFNETPGESLASQAELTKLNFDLEAQFTQLQETQPSVVREASRDSENSSSDEDDLWEEKNKEQAGSQAMEVDVVADPWTAPTLQAPPSDPWAGSNDANHAGDWADFGTFQAPTEMEVQPASTSRVIQSFEGGIKQSNETPNGSSSQQQEHSEEGVNSQKEDLTEVTTV